MKKKIILISISVVFAAAVIMFCIAYFSRIDTVRVEGAAYYSDEQIKDKVFYDEDSYRPLVAFFRNLTGKKQQIAFVRDYEVKLDSLSEAVIQVNMKPMVAYVEFMGSYLYFDMDGLVLESCGELYPDIPRVTGLDIDYVVLGRTLPVSSRTVLNQLLQITQFLSSKTIEWDGEERSLVNIIEHIHFDSSGQILLDAGDVSVMLGAGTQLEGKLPVMADILPKLSGKKGTLHLENFDFSADGQTYRFY